MTVLLFFTNLGSQNCPREMASKKESWICRSRSSQKSEGFPTILFPYRLVKSLSRLLWISQVGALTELAQPVLASSKCCSMVMTTVETALFEKLKLKINMADLKMNWAKKKQEKRRQFCEFYILFYILIKCALLQWSVEGHKSIV